MKYKAFFLIGFLLGMVPIYTITWWLRVCFAFPDSTHIERVKMFDKSILFGLGSSVASHLWVIFCGAISISCFVLLLFWSKKMQPKRKVNFYFVLNLLLLIIISIFTYFNIWSIL